MLFNLFTPPKEIPKFSRSLLASSIGEAIWNNQFPQTITLPQTPNTPAGNPDTSIQASVQYSIDKPSQDYMQDMFSRYKPDFGAFVALDATTGKIITLVSYQKNPEDKPNGNLAVRAIVPAASVFKVVTAAAAIDEKNISPDTVIAFNGSSHTLYKRNVAETKYNRWTRYMSLKQAFGKSINTVFGKVGAFYVGPKSLSEYAEKFQFDREIEADIPIEAGLSFKPDASSPFEIAEAASGFNKESRMSPLQGAMIAGAVANDGIMMQPYVVENLYNTTTGANIYQVEPMQASITMKPESAKQMRILMQETIDGGTSRKSFRQVFRRSEIADRMEMGGKTGSLTATEPRGKVDWFVGYGEIGNQRIAVAAMSINKKFWTVKSSYLGASFLESYFRRQEPESEKPRRKMRQSSNARRHSRSKIRVHAR